MSNRYAIEKKKKEKLRVALDELEGSYKISQRLLERIYKNELSGPQGSMISGISNDELLLLIKLCQIADIKGNVDFFRLLDIPGLVGCTKRNSYNVLYGLKKKGFITYEKAGFRGYYNISVCLNDFSDRDFKNNHYLNLNMEAFTEGTYSYNRFKELSLNAKKTYLKLMFGYDIKYGYSVNYSTLATVLCVNKRHIPSYIKELNKMLPGDSIKKDFSRTLTGIDSKLVMHSQNILCVTNTGITERMLNAYKFKIMTKFKQFGVAFGNSLCDKIDFRDKEARLKDGLHRLYSLTVEYMEKGLDKGFIYETIINLCRMDGIVQRYTFANIRAELDNRLRLKPSQAAI